MNSLMLTFKLVRLQLIITAHQTRWLRGDHSAGSTAYADSRASLHKRNSFPTIHTVSPPNMVRHLCFLTKGVRIEGSTLLVV
jgi:hypothetical protein